MYQTDPAQPGDTWHAAWTSTPAIAAPPVVAPPNPAPTHELVSPGARSFTNPISMRMAAAPTRWDAIANTMHGAAVLDTIKDDHANIAGTATADAEIREVLKGLLYAKTRLAAAHKGDKARTTAWMTGTNRGGGQSALRGEHAAAAAHPRPHDGPARTLNPVDRRSVWSA